MPVRKTPPDGQKLERLITEAQRERDLKEKTYRERALKLYPWICARCGREFGGKKLKELTVHHKDHNHNNNPPDGSNWELLCLYCHDAEHSKYLDEVWHDQGAANRSSTPTTSHKPFAALEALLKDKK